MNRYTITSLGADVIINKQMINLLTGDFVPIYAPVDYFATMDAFTDYVRTLNEFVEKHMVEIPQYIKDAFEED